MKILYFARISEELGKNQELLIIKDKLKIIDVINILKSKDERYSLVFKKYQILNLPLIVNMRLKTTI